MLIKVLAGVCALVGVLALLGVTTRIPAGATGSVVFAPLLYRTVEIGTVRMLTIATGLASLAVAGLLVTMPKAGLLALGAGLVWDVVCELAGLAGGHGSAGLLLVVDLVFLAALWWLRPGADPHGA